MMNNSTDPRTNSEQTQTTSENASAATSTNYTKANGTNSFLRQAAQLLQRNTWPRFIFLFLVLLAGIAIFGGVSGIGAGVLVRIWISIGLVVAGAKLFLPVWEPMLDQTQPPVFQTPQTPKSVIKRASRSFADRLAEMSWVRFTVFVLFFLGAVAMMGSLLDGAFFGNGLARNENSLPIKLKVERTGEQVSVKAIRSAENECEEDCEPVKDKKAKRNSAAAIAAKTEAKKVAEQAQMLTEQSKSKQGIDSTTSSTTVQADGKTFAKKIYENSDGKVTVEKNAVTIEPADGSNDKAQVKVDKEGVVIKAKEQDSGDTNIKINKDGIVIESVKDGVTKNVVIGAKGVKATESTAASQVASQVTGQGTESSASSTVAAKELLDTSREVATLSSTEQIAQRWEGAFKKAIPQIESQIEEAVEEGVQARLVRQHQELFTNILMGLAGVLVMIMISVKIVAGGRLVAEKAAARAQQDAQAEALKRQLTEAQLQTMQAQVEPHFLFNTLASVDFLIETDPPRASQMQKNLIQYLRSAMPKMRDGGVTTVGREVGLVRSYLEILKMRMDERLTVAFDIPYECEIAQFPPMMLQSLAENAIKHGLEPKPEGGTLTISATVRSSKLQVRVVDTGIGFAPSLPTSGTQVGLANIRERLNLLYGPQAQLIVQPNEPAGTIMTIEIPYTPLAV